MILNFTLTLLLTLQLLPLTFFFSKVLCRPLTVCTFDLVVVQITLPKTNRCGWIILTEYFTYWIPTASQENLQICLDFLFCGCWDSVDDPLACASRSFPQWAANLCLDCDRDFSSKWLVPLQSLSVLFSINNVRALCCALWQSDWCTTQWIIMCHNCK